MSEIRIISDGTPSGTRVFNGADEVRQVTDISWHVDCNGPARAMLSVYRPGIDAIAVPTEDVAYVVHRGTASQYRRTRRGLHACERTVR